VLSTNKRALRHIKAASIAGAKAAIDAVLIRHRALLSFEWLHETRYYVYLLFALTRIGAVGCSARDAQRAWAWLPLREFVRSIRINWRNPSDGILLSERKNGPGILHINRQYYSSDPADHRIFVPYFAHPEFYKAGLHNVVGEMRGRERDIRVFFAGTVSSTSYSEKFAFPILNRNDILSHIVAKFEWAITNELTKTETRPILIVATSDTRDVIDKHNLSLRRYVDTMSRSDFFICPPGWRMPHSHNLIEAMSVGTVPITNYHSYMRPSLTPDSNCLAFSTTEELGKIIDRVLCMPAIEIEHLRASVISYYEKYLEPTSFAKKLMECLPAISELVVNDESGR
jgi:hypothetical protein